MKLRVQKQKSWKERPTTEAVGKSREREGLGKHPKETAWGSVQDVSVQQDVKST